jgi:protein-L-isoaspartate(D-aspartate) O-methyltransferase
MRERGPEGLDKSNSKILDVVCGKVFVMKDLLDALPETLVYGLDISRSCFDYSILEVRNNITVGSCDYLPYPDSSFDLVVSFATIHNSELDGVRRSLKEISRFREGRRTLR